MTENGFAAHLQPPIKISVSSQPARRAVVEIPLIPFWQRKFFKNYKQTSKTKT